jgi:hypothetical protein
VRKEMLTGATMQQPSKVAKGVQQGEEGDFDGRMYAAAVKGSNGEYSRVRMEMLTGARMQQPSKVAKGSTTR